MELQNFNINKINLIDKELKRLSKEDIINRIWNKDYKVWNNNPEEISNRLGWLDCSLETRKVLLRLTLLLMR